MTSNSLNQAKGRQLIKELLVLLGENTNRKGLLETPERVIRMYQELLSGYAQDVKPVVKTFESRGYHDLVTATNIDFYSLCEHHMIPFFGKVHIGYVPNGRILGLSKFARLVDIYAKRLQTQENFTHQLAKAIEDNLHPQGYIVHVEAEHLCVAMRGIKKQDFLTKTTVKGGVLAKKPDLIDQFYRDIGSK